MSFIASITQANGGGDIRDKIIDGIRSEVQEAIEDGIYYLENNPWYVKSGYNKKEIAHLLKSAKLTISQKERLRNIIILSLNWRIGKAEFREYARLAIKIADESFINKLDELSSLKRSWAQLRAKYILDLCIKHKEL